MMAFGYGVLISIICCLAAWYYLRKTGLRDVLIAYGLIILTTLLGNFIIDRLGPGEKLRFGYALALGFIGVMVIRVVRHFESRRSGNRN